MSRSVSLSRVDSRRVHIYALRGVGRTECHEVTFTPPNRFIVTKITSLHQNGVTESTVRSAKPPTLPTTAKQAIIDVVERQAQYAAQSSDEYEELLAEGMRYCPQQDWRKAARTFRAEAGPPHGGLQPRCSAQQLGALRGGCAAVPRRQGALLGGLGELGSDHRSGL